MTNENPSMNTPQAAIDGRPIEDWAEALRSLDPGLRQEAALILTQPAVPLSHSAPVLLGALADADPKVGSLVRDFFLQLAAEICRLRSQETELKEELAKTKAVLEAQTITVLEHEKKLALRTKELEQSNRELDTFMLVVGHDLPGPLSGIDAFVHLLPHLLPERFERRDAILRIAKGVNDHAASLRVWACALSNLAKVGRVQLEPTRVRFRELVDQVRSEMSSQDAGRKVRWDVGDLPEVFADASLLRVVVTNLLSNALKFTMKCNEAVIEVRATKNDSGTIFCVRDNGAGFDGRYAEQLFQPSLRLHKITDYKGKGIGLAVVKRIVARHGGETWAEGEVGSGAAFYFSLPEKPPTC